MNNKLYKLICVFMLLVCKMLFAQDTLLVPTQDGLSKYGCYSSIKPHEVTWVASMVDANTKLTRCKTQIYPDSLTVDFTQNDLVFYLFSPNVGSVKELSYNLYKIPNQKKYVLVVKIKYNYEKYSTLRSMTHRILYITPKLDPTYTFDYKKIETYMPKPQ